MKRLDLNDDSRITRDEAPFSDRVFDAMDADRSGALDAREMAESLSEAYAQRQREGDGSVRVDAFVEEALFSPQSAIDPGNDAIAPPATIAEAGPLGDTRISHPAPNLAEEGDLRARLGALAEHIADRLDKTGFTHRPPTNLPSLLDELGLRGRRADFVLELLSARFPQGLGLSLIG